MIAKRIDHKAANDNYRALALYVAAAGHEDEKTLMSWAAGCLDDDYLSGIHEVEATQAQNTRTAKTKTYHLMISFRPEDEDKLTPETFREMELEFAAALGFDGHQRHAGVHRNTDNLHLHVAYNMIRPGNFKRIEPFRDFKKLAQVCRRLEQKYGLAVDRGPDVQRPPDAPTVNAKVKSIETQSGRESLFSYIVRHKSEIMAGLDQTANWNEVHAVFLKHGLYLKAAGNGLTIRDRHSKHSAKASAIDRALSKAKLEARLGPFEAPSADLLQTIQATKSYTAAPLQVNPERDDLYQSFLKEIADRRAALEVVNQEGVHLYEAHRAKWERKRRELERLPMLKHDRQRTRLALKKQEREELTALRVEVSAKRNAVRAERPYTTWNSYLQHLAAQGHETALAVLRSKKEEIQPEAAVTPSQVAIIPSKAGQTWADQREKILNTPGISDRHRRALQAVVKMRELLEQEAAHGEAAPELRFRIDTKGTVIFSLPGGTIRDTGREVHFSPGDEMVKTLALKLAQSRDKKICLSVDQKSTIHARENKQNILWVGR